MKATIKYALVFEHVFCSVIVDCCTERQRTHCVNANI